MGGETACAMATLLAPRCTSKGEVLVAEKPLLCAQTLDGAPLSLVCAYCGLPAGSLEEALVLQTGGSRRALQQAAAQAPRPSTAAHWCEQRCGTAFCSEACRRLAAPAHRLLCSSRADGHPIREFHSAARASSETLLLAANLTAAALAHALEHDQPAAAASAAAAALHEALGSPSAEGEEEEPVAEAVEEAGELLRAGLHAQLADEEADSVAPLLSPRLWAAALRGLERGLLPLEMEAPLAAHAKALATAGDASQQAAALRPLLPAVRRRYEMRAARCAPRGRAAKGSAAGRAGAGEAGEAEAGATEAGATEAGATEEALLDALLGVAEAAGGAAAVAAG